MSREAMPCTASYRGTSEHDGADGRLAAAALHMQGARNFPSAWKRLGSMTRVARSVSAACAPSLGARAGRLHEVGWPRWGQSEKSFVM
jgi:hypothetical protein